MRPWTLWVASFAAALALYVGTADRGVQWQDSGWQQLRIVTGQIENPLGLALSHPIQYYLGRLAVWAIPIEPAFAITLVSCLAAAVAVANLAATLLILTRSLTAALLASLALLLSHTFWQHATHTESYAITAGLLTGEWLCLAVYVTTERVWPLSLLALLNGAGVANHLLASLATPVDVAVVIAAIRSRRIPIKTTANAGLLWLLGAAPYLAAIFARLVATGEWAGTVRSALVGDYGNDVLNVRLGLRPLMMSLGYVAYNFPGLTVPLAVYALVRKLKLPRLFLRAVKWQLVLYAIFVIRYSIKDQYTFFFPVYMLLTLFSGLALADLLKGLSPLRRRLIGGLALLTAVWTPLVYVGTAAILSSRGALASLVGNKPYRDGYQALFVPWGVGEHYAAEVNRDAYSLAGADGVILHEDSMVGFALRYAQEVDPGLKDVTVVQLDNSADDDAKASLRALLNSCLSSGRSVVLVPRDRDHTTTCVTGAEWRRSGDLYVLVALNEPTSRAATRF